MKVALLGGTRFIGPYIVQQLVERGDEVAVYHRGQTKASLPHAVRHVTVDRDQPGQVAAALEQHQPDVVIDMCGYRPEQLEEVITARVNLRHYVFCSSTSVYGQIGNTTPHELSPLKPKSEYEIGKVACETMLLQAYIERGFPFTALRLAHPYGPLDELIYSTGRESLFLDRIRRGRPIVICSEGDTRMHPIYVEDAAAAFSYMIGRADCLGRIFNLAGDEVLTHDAYYASIARALNVPLLAERIPGPWFADHADSGAALPAALPSRKCGTGMKPPSGWTRCALSVSAAGPTMMPASRTPWPGWTRKA